MEAYAAPVSTPSPLGLHHSGALPVAAWSAPVGYQVDTRWEEFMHEEHRQTVITKQVQLRVQPLGAGWAVWLHTTEPMLRRKDAIQPVEQLALRVAALYEHVVVGVTPDGRLAQLLNYAQLCETWDSVKNNLLAEAADEDQLTRKLVDLVEKQVAHEENVLHSLQHDYMYQVLGQVLGTSSAGARGAGHASREFSNFFPHISLWFKESKETAVTEQQPLRFTLRGVLDEDQTNVAAIQQLMLTALALPSTAPELASTVPAPHFGYEANYTVDQTTNMLVDLTLTVYARLAQLYNKQYTLTVHRLP